MKDFRLNIPNATVYEKKPVLKTAVKNNKLCGTYTKEFSIISPQDINISGITFLEFNGTLHKVKSNPLFIKIENSMLNTNKQSKIENFTNSNITTKTIYKTNYLLIVISFIIGLSTGLILTKIFKSKNKKEKDIIEKIKKANEKELFKLLLHYSENKEIEEILKQLEENIYKGTKHKIDKKRIIEIIKKYIMSSEKRTKK
jgi:cellobiose-specific phosphotransferase system component IIB